MAKPPANNASLLDLVDDNAAQNVAKQQQNNLWNTPFQQPVQEQPPVNNNANICKYKSKYKLMFLYDCMQYPIMAYL